MDKGFVGFGPFTSPLPVRNKDQEALVRRGQVSGVMRQLFGLTAGLAGGWALLYGQLCPFALGLVLGLGEDCFAACGAGAVLALLLRGQGVRTVCLICAVGGAVVARWLWPRRYLPAMVSGCVLLMGSAFCFRMYIGGDGLLFSGADAVLAAGTGWILRHFPAEKPGAGRLVLVLCGAAALGGIPWSPVNPGLAAAVLYTLVLACRGKIQPALSSAGVAAAGLCCADPSLALGGVGLCCGAALGLLAQGDKWVCTAFYSGGALLGILAVQPPGMAFDSLAALGIGAGACLVIPRRYLLRDASLARDPAETADKPQLSAAATRLNAAAESLSSLADTVNKVYEGLPHRQEGWRWVVDNTHDTLCANCGRKEACWKEEYAVTMEGFNALRPVLEEKQQLEAQDLPGQLSRCIHPAALSGTVTRSFALYKSRQEARVHAEAMRTALTEQYSAVAQALSALGDQLGSPGSPEPYKSGRVAAFFSSLGMPPLECSVTLDDLGRTRAAVTLPRARFSQGELSALAGEVGKLCRRSFETPQKLSCRGSPPCCSTKNPCCGRCSAGRGLPPGGMCRGTLSSSSAAPPPPR